MTDIQLTQEYVRELFEYHHDGYLISKKSMTNRPSGKRIGYSLSINGKLYYTHRIIWLYHHGQLPTQLIDHINRNNKDNRIENLRLATIRQNGQNRTKAKNNTSGYTGVTFVRHANKWRAQIYDNKKLISLGYYNSKEEAAQRYDEARKIYHEYGY